MTSSALIRWFDDQGRRLMRVRERKNILGMRATTFEWDPSRGIVVLLEDLHALSEERGIEPDDAGEWKREILGIPRNLKFKELDGPSLWEIGKWLSGRSGAPLSRREDPIWQVERLKRLHELGAVTDEEFSYLEREILQPDKSGLRQRLKVLWKLGWEEKS